MQDHSSRVNKLALPWRMAEGGGPWRASIAAAVEAARHVFAAAAAAAAPAAAAGAAGAFVALLVSRLLSKPRRLLDLTAESSDGRHSHGPSAHGGNSYNESGRLKVPRVMQQAQPLSPSKVQNSELVQKFVLTGGPCGGKTTALARLRQFLEDRGFRVFIAPEAATILWTNGMSVADMKSEADVLAFQIRLMQMQIFLEDCFCSLAESTALHFSPAWHTKTVQGLWAGQVLRAYKQVDRFSMCDTMARAHAMRGNQRMQIPITPIHSESDISP
eukprot:2077171-Pleurochrysis_carterae.AAC.1